MNFFVQVDKRSIEELQEQIFSILYFGKGYSADYVFSMTTAERQWHVKRLNKQLKEEKDAHDKAVKESKEKSKRKK